MGFSVHLHFKQQVRWRITEDILLVICEDDTVYVWGLSTGHLDRVESGSIALNIISASPRYRLYTCVCHCVTETITDCILVSIPSF